MQVLKFNLECSIFRAPQYMFAMIEILINPLWRLFVVDWIQENFKNEETMNLNVGKIYLNAEMIFAGGIKA